MRLRSIAFGLTLFSILSVFAGCSPSGELLNECYSISQYRKSSLPSFQYYPMNVRADEKSRLDVYVQMPLRNIRFEKKLESFRASFTVSFIIKNNENEIVQTKDIDRVIDAKQYEETISPKSDFFMQSFLLVPASYSLEITAIDNLSRLLYRERKIIDAKNFSDSSFSVSSILLLDTIIAKDGVVSLRPIMPSTIAQIENSFGLFQEVYNIASGDTIKTTLQYLFPKRKLSEQSQPMYFMTPPYRITSSSCMREYDSVGYQYDSVLTANSGGTLQLFQTFPISFSGSAIIRRSVAKLNSEKKSEAAFSFPLFRREPAYRKELSPSEILFALRFILRPVEYDSLAQLSGIQLREKTTQFWEERGGKQRRMDFEKRIAEANALFTSCVEGCKTPMGITYIICGAPDYVECRSFSEFWFYNVGERVYSIEFRADRDMHPRYYELAPFSVNENVWRYFVERWRRKQ